jgi:hypothetical protein
MVMFAESSAGNQFMWSTIPAVMAVMDPALTRTPRVDVRSHLYAFPPFFALLCFV